jgi:uncharacterized phage protein (TIGR01671 family)
MRQIKFRVWSIEKQKWLDTPPGIWDSYDFGKINEPLRVQHRSSGEHLHWQENLVIQQFTGIKDKNGREIFEGDIVKYSRCRIETIEGPKGVFSSRAIETGDEIGEIIFIFPSFCWSCDYKRCDDIQEMTPASHRYEVIGNVFENSELLK